MGPGDAKEKGPNGEAGAEGWTEVVTKTTSAGYAASAVPTMASRGPPVGGLE
jgi:hypothetical protein